MSGLIPKPPILNPNSPNNSGIVIMPFHPVKPQYPVIQPPRDKYNGTNMPFRTVEQNGTKMPFRTVEPQYPVIQPPCDKYNGFDRR